MTFPELKRRFTSLPWFIRWGLFIALTLGIGFQLEHTYRLNISNQRIVWGKLAMGDQRGEKFSDETYHKNSSTSTAYGWWNFDYDYKGNNPIIRLRVDDCIEEVRVDSQIIELDKLIGSNSCTTWLNLDFGPYLKKGINHIKILVSDTGGAFEVSTARYFWGGLGLDQTILLIWLLPVIIYCGMRLCPAGMDTRHARYFRVLFYLGLSLYAYHWILTYPTDNTHDIEPHMDYIRFLLHSINRPTASDCIECYQPPTYYVIAAMLMRSADWLGIYNHLNLLKALALLFYMGILQVSMKLILRLFTDNRAALLAFALFVFWPLASIKSTDINTDMPVTLAIMTSFLFTLHWYQAPRFAEAVKALLIAALAMLVKTNGIVAFAIFGVTFIIALVEKRVRFDRQLIRYTLLAAACLAVGSANIAFLHLTSEGDTSLFVVNTVEGNPYLWIPDDRPSYYLTFPLEDYLNAPFLQTSDDATGRKYFWSSMFKTSLYGEWQFELRFIAYVLNMLLLAMVGFCLWVYGGQLFAKDAPHVAPHKPGKLYALLGALLLSMLISFRISQPAGCNQDVRYIYTIVPLFCMGYAGAVNSCFTRYRARAGWFGLALALAFIVFSIMAVIGEYWKYITG